MEFFTLTVSTRSHAPYEVQIGEGALRCVGARVCSGFPGAAAFVVTDANVNALFGRAVMESLASAGVHAALYEVPAGEESKGEKQLFALYDAMAKAGITRNDIVVALGGGVVGDLAGFAAATYMRGVRLVMLPTTLLSQVDSSIGGKTAVDAGGKKNLIGAFKQPDLVLCDTGALASLDARQYACGMAEVIKYGCICDAELFCRLEHGGVPDAELVRLSLVHKKRYVEQDELDTGIRRELNFGHTIGHAVEAASGYALTHGEAVAVGMCAAADLGEALKLTAPGTGGRIRAAIAKHKICADEGLLPALREGIKNNMALDKKAEHGSISMVLLESIGKACVVRVKTSDIIRILWK